MLPQRDCYIQSCYRNETIIFSRATATTLLYSVVLSQRHYYIQSCYRNENIIFSRAIATTLLYSVVLSQRHYYIQSCYRNDMIFNQKDEVRKLRKFCHFCQNFIDMTVNFYRSPKFDYFAHFIN